jgi:hypothetical protein
MENTPEFDSTSMRCLADLGDLRTRPARRLRDLSNAYVSELPPSQRTAMARQLCRCLASLSMRAEAQDALLASGEETDAKLYCQLISLTNQIAKQLGLSGQPAALPRKRRAGDEIKTLEEYVEAISSGEIEPDLNTTSVGPPRRDDSMPIFTAPIHDDRDDHVADDAVTKPELRSLQPISRRRRVILGE